MLRQLLYWVSIICVCKVNAQDFLQRKCYTDQCKEVEKRLRYHVHVSSEPCENFLEYSCKFNITGGRAEYSNEDEYLYNRGAHYFDNEQLIHKLANDFHYFLTDYFNKEQQNQALTWEQAVYAKCRKLDVNNERNENYYMHQLGDGRRLHSNDKTDYYAEKLHVESWTVPDRKYAKKGVGFAFFDFNIVTQKGDQEDRRYIQISPTSDNPLAILDFFRTYYNVTHNTHIRKYVLLKDFLDKLNQIVPRPGDDEMMEETSNDPKPTTIFDWQREWDMYAAGSHLNWLSNLNHIGFKSLRRNDLILIKDIDKKYFQGLAERLHNVHTQTITDFVHLRYVMKTIGFVKQEYRKYAIIPHMDGLACSPGFMVGAAHVFMSKYFPIEDKRLMETMFNEIQFNIQQKLGNLKNDPAPAITRNFLRKLTNPEVVIGYPEWMNSSEAVSLYSIGRYAVSDSFFQNQMYALEALREYQVQSYEYGSPLINQMQLYYKSLIELEDFQFDMDNKEIIIPLSLFNEHTYRYFSNLLYNPMNYASAGTAIAQKLYFAYLDLISYGESGKIPKCIEDNVRDIYVNKVENIRESASWLLAVRDSYEIWPDHDGLPIRFQIFGAITPQRLFYITFAQSLCQLPNSERKGPATHINFAVTHSKGFQDAFRCKYWDKNYVKIYDENRPCKPLV